jgi:hypothetical protein
MRCVCCRRKYLMRPEGIFALIFFVYRILVNFEFFLWSNIAFHGIDLRVSILQTQEYWKCQQTRRHWILMNLNSNRPRLDSIFSEKTHLFQRIVFHPRESALIFVTPFEVTQHQWNWNERSERQYRSNRNSFSLYDFPIWTGKLKYIQRIWSNRSWTTLSLKYLLTQNKFGKQNIPVRE